MKALVKKYSKPGLWMKEVPIPEYGINDVTVDPLTFESRGYTSC
jgi:hypothetical protein